MEADPPDARAEGGASPRGRAAGLSHRGAAAPTPALARTGCPGRLVPRLAAAASIGSATDQSCCTTCFIMQASALPGFAECQFGGCRTTSTRRAAPCYARRPARPRWVPRGAVPAGARRSSARVTNRLPVGDRPSGVWLALHGPRPLSGVDAAGSVNTFIGYPVAPLRYGAPSWLELPSAGSSLAVSLSTPWNGLATTGHHGSKRPWSNTPPRPLRLSRTSGQYARTLLSYRPLAGLCVPLGVNGIGTGVRGTLTGAPETGVAPGGSGGLGIV